MSMGLLHWLLAWCVVVVGGSALAIAVLFGGWLVVLACFGMSFFVTGLVAVGEIRDTLKRRYSPTPKDGSTP